MQQDPDTRESNATALVRSKEEVLTEHDEKTKSPRRLNSSDRSKTGAAHVAARSIRAALVFAAVGSLVAVITLPALAVGGEAHADASAVTAENLAAQNAQSIVIAPDVTPSPDTRDTFTATTPDEIAKKKAEQAARAAAEQAAKARVASATGPQATDVQVDMTPSATPGQVM